MIDLPHCFCGTTKIFVSFYIFWPESRVWVKFSVKKNMRCSVTLVDELRRIVQLSKN